MTMMMVFTFKGQISEGVLCPEIGLSLSLDRDGGLGEFGSNVCSIRCRIVGSLRVTWKQSIYCCSYMIFLSFALQCPCCGNIKLVIFPTLERTSND